MGKFIRTIFHVITSHKIISLVVFAVLLVIFLIFRPKSPTPLDTTMVRHQDLIQSISVSGTVSAKKLANLSFVASGQLVYLGAQRNDAVVAGQTIAALDNRTVQKSLEQALLDYSKQRNTFDQARINNGINQDSDVPVNDNVKRVLQNNQYDLNKAVNSVELQDLAKQQSFLTSPISGVLTRADAASVGSTVTPATVFTVTNPSSIVFSMDVDEADIGKVLSGQPVTVTLDAYPDRALHFTVDSIDFVSHATSNGGNAFSVEVKLPADSVGQYRVGMNGNGEIITAQKNGVLTVPIASLVDDTYVYTKINNVYEKRKLVLGLQNDTDVEVVSGLSEGEKVVLQPSKILPSQLKKN